ncbi:hypothetical protein C8F04DRAFT_1122090 [Mycena alexandri]|uniref:G domain-containing protein n=1 Tax=Mycena alexandri TaxID=1745969 RepID=A0AAD6WW90_9AGAR|nr:hypothetical protein C8F04DRAFT_1122090 [Mycena alexandri]
MANERTIDDILKACERFRIVSIGGSGAGKSSLVNSVFGVSDAKVSHFAPGEADIYHEFTSESNPRFVLHDSKGFEPAKMETFHTVRQFILDKSNEDLELKDRLHAVWLCIRTPTDGGRVLEVGDEEFLRLAHERQIPVIIVFTQYDRLVRKFRDNREYQAQRDFERCIESLEKAAIRLKIAMPKYKHVSVRKTYDGNIVPLVEMTKEIVQERLKGDAWIIWAVAQRASVPLKVEACIEKGMTYYWRSLSGGSVPGLGKTLLHECLMKVHQDIIACWNLRDGEMVLNGVEFKHLMLYVVQDMQDKTGIKSSSVDVVKIHNFVMLCTTATATIAPPVAILGLTYIFIKWISDAVLDNTPKVRRLFFAYVADLILVLEELFKMALRPQAAGSVNWETLQEAFDAYHRTTEQSNVHVAVNDLVERHGQLNTDLSGMRSSLDVLLRKHRVFNPM